MLRLPDMSKSLRWLRHRVRQIPGAIAYVRRLRDWSRAATEAIRDLGALVGVAWSRLVKGRAPAEGPLRVFMLDDKLPNPTFGAGFPRAAEILKSLLKMGCRVDFYPMEANCADLEEMSRMFGLGVTWHLPLGLRGLRRLLWMKASDIDVLFVSRP